MPAKPIQPPTEQNVKNVKRVIESLLTTNGLMVLVGLYFNGFPDTDFAGHLFDTLSDNPPEEVVASDLVAVSLLDVNFGAKAADILLNNRESANRPGPMEHDCGPDQEAVRSS